MNSQDKRIYSYYQSLRRASRTPDLRREEFKNKPGSFFNHLVSQVAERFSVPMDQVREAIVLGYADKHSLTVDESREHFDSLRNRRQNNHENGNCTVNGLNSAYGCNATR